MMHMRKFVVCLAFALAPILGIAPALADCNQPLFSIGYSNPTQVLEAYPHAPGDEWEYADAVTNGNWYMQFCKDGGDSYMHCIVYRFTYSNGWTLTNIYAWLQWIGPPDSSGGDM
jgi:hypothetical protein